jgi:hypothetical protein
MPLPNSGQISFSDMNTEIGRTAGTQLDIATARKLFNVTNTTNLAMTDFYGKSFVYWSQTLYFSTVSAVDACNNANNDPGANPITVYWYKTESATLQNGIELFGDNKLQTYVADRYYSDGTNSWQVVSGVLTNETVCSGGGGGGGGGGSSCFNITLGYDATRCNIARSNYNSSITNTYYIDNATWGSATALYSDNTCSTPAASGQYSADGLTCRNWDGTSFI